MSTPMSRIIAADMRPARMKRQRRGRERAMLSAHGEPVIWTSGGALAIAVAMVVGLLALIVFQGVSALALEPHATNVHGRLFPGIVGTAVLTLLMTLVVVPFGVLAALYLHEYAKAGFTVSLVRIAIRNLAGVPSIVIGVFGLGFFCHSLGAFIDGGPRNVDVVPMPASAWWLASALAAGLGAAGFFAGFGGMAAGPGRRRAAVLLWLGSLSLFLYLVVHSPYFRGFYEANLPTPTFGTGGVLWAALTLALLTLPVVVVATEEALAAVPHAVREGSYACGASQWQTIWRIVLPRALPGVLTGTILAIARGAGEVAPLLLVGAWKSAAELPVDGAFPYFHPSNGFTHLGRHVYDAGMKSVEHEAARPSAFAATLVLIVVVASLNLTAVWLRSRLRRRDAVHGI